jgi:hypothetical protein
MLLAMTHKEQAVAAKAKILELEREKQRIDAELEAWRKIRDAHEQLAKNDSMKELVSSKIGPTDAILIILGKYPTGLTPTQIRDQLKEYGIACGTEKNFVGNIHAIIKRHKSIEGVPEGGRTLYRLKSAASDYAGGVPNPLGRTMGEMLKK